MKRFSDLHIRLHVREDGGLNVIAFAASTCDLGYFATQAYCSAFILTTLDVSQYFFVLHFAVLWPLVHTLIEVVSDFQRRHTLRICGYELVVNVFVDIYTSSCMTGLTEVHIDAPGTPFYGFFYICIGEYDVLEHVNK